MSLSIEELDTNLVDETQPPMLLSVLGSQVMIENCQVSSDCMTLP